MHTILFKKLTKCCGAFSFRVIKNCSNYETIYVGVCLVIKSINRIPVAVRLIYTSISSAMLCRPRSGRKRSFSMTCRWFRANRPAATVKHRLQWVTRAEAVTRRIHKSSLLQRLTSEMDGYAMFDTPKFIHLATGTNSTMDIKVEFEKRQGSAKDNASLNIPRHVRFRFGEGKTR